MKRNLYLLLGLVLLLVLLIPSAALAAQPIETTVYLHNTGNTPSVGGQWHFVLNGIVTDYNPNISLHVIWSDGTTSDFTGAEANINQHQASWAVPYVPGLYPLSTVDNSSLGVTSANVPGGSTGILTLSAPIAPVPEVPAIILLGVGLAGIAAFVIIKKRKSMARAS